MYQQYRDIWEELISPGEQFEIKVQNIRGVPTRTYAHAPGSLRDVFLASAPFADQDYLVYNDERLTYGQVH